MASSILNSDDGVISGTSGLKSTGGDDGVLVFQSKGTETAQINTDKQIVAAAGTASLPIYSTTGDLNTGIYFPAADTIGFATNGVIRGRWTTDGLCFGSDTAAANALDDYEEGTWTPGSAVGTLSFARPGYIKIGSQVTLWAVVENFSDRSSGNAVEITGAPFSINASFSDLAVGSGMWSLSTANGDAVYMSSLSRLQFYAGTTSGGFSSLKHNNLTSVSSACFFVVTYRAA